jgi:hypothetical protein
MAIYYNTVNTLIDTFRNHPKRTILIICVIALISISATFSSAFNSEMGKKEASDGELIRNKASNSQLGKIGTDNQRPVIIDNDAHITYLGEPVKVIDPGEEKQRAIQLLKAYLGVSTFDIYNFYWFSSIKKGEKNLLFVVYEERDIMMSDIFSSENQKSVIRLYHDTCPGLFCAKDIKVGYYGNKAYMFIYNIGGSASYLNGHLYFLDDIENLTNCYTIENIFSGSVGPLGDKILISSNYKTYIFIQENEQIELQEYVRNIKYPDFGINVHILQISEVNNTMGIRFDNGQKVLLNNLEPYRLENTLGIDDEIIVTSNFGDYRIFINSLDNKLEFQRGVFLKIIVKDKGQSKISILSPAYGDFSYEIILNIE